MKVSLFSALRVFAVIIGATLIVVVGVSAITTIGTNVTTGGTLTVSGQATTSVSLWVGAAGTVNNPDMLGGDLYVQNDVEIDGTLYGAAATLSSTLGVTGLSTFTTLTATGLATFGNVTSTSATTTNYLYIGPDITEPTAGWDFSGGDLIVADDAFINSQATTSVSLWVGSGGTVDSINMAGGDLYVQNDVEIDGTLYVTALSGNLAVTGTFTASGNATSTGNFVVGSDTGSATTTLKIKTVGASGVGACIEMEGVDGNIYAIYVNEGGTALVVEQGNCN